MKIKKIPTKWLVVGIIILVAVAALFVYQMIGSKSPFKSEREASGAIANVSSGVEQISSIIEDIDTRLGK